MDYDNSGESSPCNPDDIDQDSSNDKPSNFHMGDNQAAKHKATLLFMRGDISFDELTYILERQTSLEVTDSINSEAATDTIDTSLDSRNAQDCLSLDLNEGDHADEGSLKRKKTRNRSKLPRDLVGLMGEANLCFARGKYDDAIRMCQEIIRNAPNCPEPFDSLGTHYEGLGDDEKAIEFLHIAAYLQPSNSDAWVRVAEMATKRRDFRLASTCYTKAIKGSPNKPELHWRRCRLYEQLGDQKRALKGYDNLVNALGPKEDQLALDLARGIARIHQKNDDRQSAIKALENAFHKYSNRAVNEDIFNLCRLYNLEKSYLKIIDTLCIYCNLHITINNAKWNLETMSEFLINQQVPSLEINLDHCHRFDLRHKCMLLVALVCCKFKDRTIDILSNDIFRADPAIYKDCLYDVAKAFMENGSVLSAKRLLAHLTNQSGTQTAATWLLYSRCLKELDELDGAIDAYKKVVDLDPTDFRSRLALSNLLSVQGRMQEATETTRQTLFIDQPVDITLLFQRCKLLENSQNWREYCICARALLMTDMNYIQHPKEILSMITSKFPRTRLENLRDVQRELRIDSSRQKQKSIGEKLDTDSMLMILLRLVNILYHVREDFEELKKICFSAYTCSSLECYENAIDFLSMMACFKIKDLDCTYVHVKTIAYRNPDNNQIWNILASCMSHLYSDLRHSRFCLRMFINNSDVLPLALFNGHNALMTGSYKHALGEYMNVFRENPNDPFAAFCVAITFLSLSCQKYISSKYLCVFQMIAFLHIYLELRGTCQESMFNIGRAFHQVNMLDKAVIFYRRVLILPSPIVIENNLISREIFSLRREAAFNLSLIYKNSKSFDLAYQLIKDNFTI